MSENDKYIEYQPVNKKFPFLKLGIITITGLMIIFGIVFYYYRNFSLQLANLQQQLTIVSKKEPMVIVKEMAEKSVATPEKKESAPIVSQGTCPSNDLLIILAQLQQALYQAKDCSNIIDQALKATDDEFIKEKLLLLLKHTSNLSSAILLDNLSKLVNDINAYQEPTIEATTWQQQFKQIFEKIIIVRKVNRKEQQEALSKVEKAKQYLLAADLNNAGKELAELPSHYQPLTDEWIKQANSLQERYSLIEAIFNHLSGQAK